MLKQILEFKEVKEKISNWDNELVRELILTMLKEGRISFEDISKSYVKYLEILNQDNLAKLNEAENCAVEHLFYKKGKMCESEKKSIQRTLYLANKSRRFNMEELNKKFNYDEESAKKLSCYEREKKYKEEKW